jgi:type III restriction enzyme
MQALGEWVEAVNTHGGFGRWDSGVSYDPADVADILSHQASQ